jgi:hypothetical protein
MSGVRAAGLLRIAAKGPERARCAVTQIAYIGAIQRAPAGGRDPVEGETGKPGPGNIGDDGDTAAPAT